MIPKTIHYCAFGPAMRTAMVSRCLESWRRHLPDYAVKEWNESNSPVDLPYCRAAMAAGRWSRLSNWVRLHALHEEGGIYLDTDVEIIRHLDPLLAHSCFLAFQQVEEDEDWVNNAVLGAEAGHPFLARCLQETISTFETEGQLVRSPVMTTRVLRQMGLIRYGLQRCEDVTLLPQESFYPYPWYSSFTPDCVTADTYCIHHWAASWHSGMIGRLLHNLRRARRSLASRRLCGRDVARDFRT
ncbi:MAG: glycosyltransferase [Planctomycetia bacterium]|nr:glycosyltransferase [Planctomycetia bacterium]